MLEIIAKTSRHDEAAAHTDSRPAGFSHTDSKREFMPNMTTTIIAEKPGRIKPPRNASKKVKKYFQNRLTRKENYAKLAL